MTGVTNGMRGPSEISWPVAVAARVDSLEATRPDRTGWVAEPMWDGYRAVWAGGELYGRRGKNLTGYFPDLADALSAHLPASVVIDGEIVCWDIVGGRPDFAGLQARLTAGSRIAAVAALWPAQLVAFDLLSYAGHDLRMQPLSDRRRQLAGLLSGLALETPEPIVLCAQTNDVGKAREWLAGLTSSGIEGVVTRNADAPYPTESDQQVWRKVRARPSCTGPGGW